MTGEIEYDTLFEMANLLPADTGLPMVIWASERGHAGHDAGIKVNQSHGTRVLPGRIRVWPDAGLAGNSIGDGLAR